MRRLLALKWRLLPLLAAAAIIVFPFINGAVDRYRISNEAKSAQARLDKQPAVSKIQGIPDRIVIPSLAIDLPVVPQSYSKIIKSWPVAQNEANYAVETAPINNTKGQSLIYGHDTREVFGPLQSLQPGAEVFLYTSNGHVFKYSFISFKDVSPRQVNIVSDMTQAPAGLNLITCSGSYFQYRHLMSFKLLNAS